MSAALVVLPNFALIVVGLALARGFDYGREFWAGLERLVYFVLFPALLFRSLAIARIDYGAAGVLVACGIAFTVASFGLSVLAGPVLRLERRLLAAGSQCGYRFNTYIGLAVAGSLFGTQGVALAALLFGAMIPVANFGAVAMLARHGERGFLAELARHPLVLACVAGYAWNAAGATLPSFADQTLALLGESSLPAGLLCVGAAMRMERGGAAGEGLAHAWWLAVKLVAAPAIAHALARALSLPATESRVLVLCAALPTATNAYILAVRMAGDGRAVATQITLGTLISMATLPFWLSV
ncbi:MAG TPA: AEC family transporter [Usitatibacter sp.]|nr:AEC family transporter [Usitatibacter sp.]